MLPYIIIYVFLFLLSFRIKKDKWNVTDFIFLTTMIVFSAVRYGIGTDYFLYEGIFENSAYNLDTLATNRTGIGFSYLCNLFNRMGLSYQALIAIIACITLTCFYIFFKKNSKNPGKALLFYISLGFYTSSFNGFRQMLSLSLLLLAFSFYQDKKNIKCIVFSIISFLIHSSSLFGIILYFIIYSFKNKKINFFIVYPIGIILSLFYNTIFSSVINLFDQYAGYLTYESSPGIGTYLIILFYFCVTVFLIIYNKKKILNYSNNTNYMINLLILGNLIMLFQVKNWLFTRIAIYCTIFVPILLSEYYEASKIKNNKGVSLAFYIVMFIYFIIYTISFGGVVPYKSILLNK